MSAMTVSREQGERLKKAGVEFPNARLHWITYADGDIHLSSEVPPWVITDGTREVIREPAIQLHDLMMTEGAKVLDIRIGWHNDDLRVGWYEEIESGMKIHIEDNQDSPQSAIDHIADLIAEHAEGRGK